MKEKLVFSLLAVLFASCAASLPYGTDYPLTEKTFRSRDGVFSGNIPQGWFSSTEDTLGSALTVWLMKDDLSAILIVKEIKLDRLSAQQVENEGLKLLVNISIGLQSALSAVAIPEQKEFELHDKKFCSYEIMKKRVVVFTVKGRFYDCEAQAVHGFTQEEYARLFTAQQTFLSSLIY